MTPAHDLMTTQREFQRAALLFANLTAEEVCTKKFHAARRKLLDAEYDLAMAIVRVQRSAGLVEVSP